MVASMDPKGMRSGFEIELMKQITSLTNVQVINCGGCGKVEHIVQLWDKADVSAAACSLIFLAIYRRLPKARKTCAAVALSQVTARERRMNSVVIDYGLCNLLGVYKALKHSGVTAKVIHYPSDLISAERANLPGEEAFEEGMNMTKKQLVESSRDFAKTWLPFMGICLRIQF